MATQAKPYSKPAVEIPDSLYTEREIMSIANVSRTSLVRWDKKGIFPSRIKIGEHSIRYKKSEVDEWLVNPQAWVEKHAPIEAA
ncbi:MAG: helix-turn-helix domain-containing protein [Candidatus Thiodiazotropha endolucinida]